MTVRPPLPGEDNGYPGVPYLGDVGLGGFEEIDAVVEPAMNFGWPCWEGPMPCPPYRDALYNFQPDYIYNTGCNGDSGQIGGCGPIQTIAYDDDGVTRLTCPLFYKNKTINMPFFYYSRYPYNPSPYYFGGKFV